MAANGPTPGQSDGEIVARSWTEPEAFEELYRRYGTVIERHLARRVGHDAAADLAAEVFTRAFAGRSRYRAEFASARPWLFGITANVLRHHFRQRARSARANLRLQVQTEARVADPAPDVDRRIDADRAVAGMAVRLRRLRDCEREVLAAYAHGMTYAEIAGAAGIPIGTVRSRLARARKRVAPQPAP